MDRAESVDHFDVHYWQEKLIYSLNYWLKVW